MGWDGTGFCERWAGTHLGLNGLAYRPPAPKHYPLRVVSPLTIRMHHTPDTQATHHTPTTASGDPCFVRAAPKTSSGPWISSPFCTNHSACIHPCKHASCPLGIAYCAASPSIHVATDKIDSRSRGVGSMCRYTWTYITASSMRNRDYAAHTYLHMPDAVAHRDPPEDGGARAIKRSTLGSSVSILFSFPSNSFCIHASMYLSDDRDVSWLDMYQQPTNRRTQLARAVWRDWGQLFSRSQYLHN